MELVAAGVRAALRAMPAIGYQPDWDDKSNFSINPSEFVDVLQALLCLVVLCENERLRTNVRPTGSIRFVYWEYPPLQSVYSCIKAGFDTDFERSDVERALEYARHSIAWVAKDHARKEQQNIEEDCQHSDAVFLRRARSKSQVFEKTLWKNGTAPEGLSVFKDKLFGFWDDDLGTWAFWRRWYQGLLDGEPIDWDLQREVALIPDADWKQGPEHIAQKIAEIEARFALKARNRDLERELARASGNRLGIGGNNPPEPIDGAPEIARELDFIREPLQKLKEEVDADIPDKDRIRKLLGLLTLGLRKGLEWCAAKANLAVDTAIKWAIPAAGGGYLAMNPDKVQAVIDAARAWLSALP